ncbi:uncharacterized protein LOC123918661 isoform X1 [Trifolium pratense]|uniref:uncharacterized protein LOC123918661 isoform X1 n=1 Tax=Trifolium pratense TaxID=57577 RepID=UPI001E697078|nr:uncharacterized protein LOC123918661 isoform X1 [Trifolium pratense]XP_045826707.1 uncharacterized protein LOC123918661 isoform X1 [Trifolium pratense]
MKAFVCLLMALMMCGCAAVTKECSASNIMAQSHTLQYELLESKNQACETWNKEELSSYHVTPTDESTWGDLLPRKFLSEEQKNDWAVTYRKIKNMGVFKPPVGFLKEVPLGDVKLLEGSIHAVAQQTNLEYMLMLDVDRLLWSFRKTAGLPTPGTPYGGWEVPDIEIRGHFVGHYLSASALMWASTKNDTLKGKMTALVAGLSACQEKIGTGYLSAYPSEFFDRLEDLKPVWVPYYTLHKILAGLLDQYTVAGNPQALKMVTWMVDYFYNRVMNVISKNTVARHYKTLDNEVGGMNDVLYRLYTITGDSKHVLLAQLFEKPYFLGVLALQVDYISDFHANTHIPVVVGAQMRYEVTGDPLYKEIGTFFMDLVNSSHSYATGGTSVGEFWRNPDRIADNIKSPETEESCTAYNMLKVSRNLFRWTKEVTYADYYERAITNGVLSIQRGTEPGVMIYMLPLGIGVSKAISFHGWGKPFDTFWCCYGTGIESFSKLGDSIYFEEQGNSPSLYIIQYISSSFNWKTGKVLLTQTVVPSSSSDPYLRVTFTFSPIEQTGISSSLKFRVPSWTRADGAKAILNAETLSLPAPGNFLSITRQWSTGDKLTLEFPLTIRTEAIKDDRPEYASVQAILYGPYLLAGHSTNNWDWDIKAGTDWITPIPSSYNSQLVSFSQDFQNSTFVITNSNQSLTMQNLPAPGTDIARYATFRLIPKDATNKLVMIEPFHLPGTIISHQEPNQPLTVVDSSKAGPSSVFLVVPGLDGRNQTISLQSQSNKDCYVHSDMTSGSAVKLSCKSNSEASFNQATSFVSGKGLRQYNPISFVAKGANQNFLLEPLFNFRDEQYTVYFKMATPINLPSNSVAKA